MRRKVHQYHAGSALNDAITNAMLLIRALLRAEGFESDIFVSHRDRHLADELYLASDLPHHGDYVLLLHHSTGHGGIDAIIALPAPKILVYHNITPPEFYEDGSHLQHSAQLGRDQLAQLRPQTVAAIAMSEFNALELRALGFEAVQVCPLLFDLAALRQRAARSRRPRDLTRFTILFVGRITQSKAQNDLVDAFAAFRARYPGRARLVLPGAFSPDERIYVQGLRAQIYDTGLAGDVVLPGLIPDEELHDWYSQATLYVSLSHHEGFGVPLVEAMVHGVPVLAWPAGAVPYTVPDRGLLTARDPESVAARMLALAADPGQAADLVARQHDSLAAFDLNGQTPMLLRMLALAGALAPPGRPETGALVRNMRFTLTGHVSGTYSLAAITRDLAHAIEARRPDAIRLLPVEGAPAADLSGVPSPDRFQATCLAGRPIFPTGPEIVISHHYPLYVPPARGDLCLALFAWEESLIPAATVEHLNAHFAGVLAPSSFVARALVNSGVAIPVINTGQPPRLSSFTRVARQPGKPFTFLHVSSGFPRKGIDVLLAAWPRAFTATDDVRLVIKTFPNMHNDADAQIETLRAASPQAAPIDLINRDIARDEMFALFARADCVVLPTRGEGYNLVAAEAMAAGLKLIVTGFGGHMDFCAAKTARIVEYQLAFSKSHLAPPHSVWAEPDVSDLAAALKEAVSPGQTAGARAAILVHADPAAFVDRLAAAAARLLLDPPAPRLRIAWISSWDVKCGVAEYSRALLAALPPAGIERLAVLADDRTPPDGDSVRPCWRLGGAKAVEHLAAAVMTEDPGFVMVQHQPGIITWLELAVLLPMLVAQGRAVAVTLHNTRHLLDIPGPSRHAVCHALAGVARVLVHTLTDLNRLAALGLTNTSLFVHGAPASAAASTVRPLPPDAVPIIACYGFFLPGKGIGRLIQAVANLRAEWPAARLRLVNAEYDDPASAREIASCQAAAEAAGLAVEWHTAFQPMEQSIALLAGCDLIVLPYDDSNEASSAALRSALSAGVPVAVTPIAIFDEAAGVVARLPGFDPAEIASGMAALLHDPARRQVLTAAAADWLAARAWARCGARLHGMALGLAAQRRLGIPFDGRTWPPT